MADRFILFSSATSGSVSVPALSCSPIVAQDQPHQCADGHNEMYRCDGTCNLVVMVFVGYGDDVSQEKNKCTPIDLGSLVCPVVASKVSVQI